MDFLYLGAAAVMALALFGLIAVCDTLGDKSGARK
jgi:hypothetical protein